MADDSRFERLEGKVDVVKHNYIHEVCDEE